MNDLRNGIVDLDGFLMGPDSTVEAIESFFGIASQHNDNTPFYRFDFDGKIFHNNGIDFKVHISFDENRPMHVILTPIFPEIAEKYDLCAYSDDLLPYFKEIRVILDKWLEAQLGEPTCCDEDTTYYQFEGLLISSPAYIDHRNRDYSVVGGWVKIYYEK